MIKKCFINFVFNNKSKLGFHLLNIRHFWYILFPSSFICVNLCTFCFPQCESTFKPLLETQTLNYHIKCNDSWKVCIPLCSSLLILINFEMQYLIQFFHPQPTLNFPSNWYAMNPKNWNICKNIMISLSSIYRWFFSRSHVYGSLVTPSK